MKKLIGIVLTVLMIMTLCIPVYADAGIGVEPGQDMPDFTVELTDGTTATLSEILKDKDLVVLNIFATWCGPCEVEFPDMEKVYQANSDRMVILSVSGDPDDTMEMISEYKAGHSLTFPMGRAGDALNFLRISGFPTTIFINRDGKVGFTKVGAFVTEGEFEDKVNTFLSADYSGEVLASEKASSPLPFMLGWILIGTVLLVIGRWLMLRKAGMQGWHALIPLLSTYREYSLCWKGWLGVLSELCTAATAIISLVGLSGGPGTVLRYILLAAGLLISIPEGFKLAKAFGKGKAFGVLLMLPGFKYIGRFILGVSKAKYQGK